MAGASITPAMLEMAENISRIQHEHPEVWPRPKTSKDALKLKNLDKYYSMCKNKLIAIEEGKSFAATSVRSAGDDGAGSVRFSVPDLASKPSGGLLAAADTEGSSSDSGCAAGADGGTSITEERRTKLRGMLMHPGILAKVKEGCAGIDELNIPNLSYDEFVGLEHATIAAFSASYGELTAHRAITAASRAAEFALGIPKDTLVKINEEDKALQQDTALVVSSFAGGLPAYIRAGGLFAMNTAAAFFATRREVTKAAAGAADDIKEEKPLVLIAK